MQNGTAIKSSTPISIVTACPFWSSASRAEAGQTRPGWKLPQANGYRDPSVVRAASGAGRPPRRDSGYAGDGSRRPSRVSTRRLKRRMWTIR